MQIKRKPLVYIASPHKAGDQCINARFQCEIFHELLTDGIVLPFVPLLSHFLHFLQPRPYYEWIQYDLELLASVNFAACLRLNADHVFATGGGAYHQSESYGADGEVVMFKELRKPVFYNKNDLYEWASGS